MPSGKQLDRRRVSQVRPKAPPDPAELALGLGDYAGDTKAMNDRIKRIRELWFEGRGPMAWLERFLSDARRQAIRPRAR